MRSSAEARGESSETAVLEADGPELARLLELNRARLAMQLMLGRGETKEKAEGQVATGLDLLRYLGRGRMVVRDEPEETSLELQLQACQVTDRKEAGAPMRAAQNREPFDPQPGPGSRSSLRGTRPWTHRGRGPPASPRRVRAALGRPQARPLRRPGREHRSALERRAEERRRHAARGARGTLEAMAGQLAPSADLARIQAIWLYRMIFTPHPLRERMTLFWHNHFATSDAKVQNPLLMQRQNDLLRSQALGDFRALVSAIGKDPAMLIWLDSTINRKAKPNENYAREVMELFTLGRGHYTEKDIQEAARAFTGWFVVRDEFQEVPRQHDGGPKTVLGQTGNFDGDDIPGILLEQPACAEFICRKLFRHFVSETDTPSDALIAPLAAAFRDSGYQIQEPVEMILRSNLFFDPSVRRRRVKRPVEFAVGTIRALEIVNPTVATAALAESCARMGQSLFAPPSVAGWDGGPGWINSTAMLARANLALGLLSGRRRRLWAGGATLGSGRRARFRPPQRPGRVLHRPAGCRTHSSPRPGSRSSKRRRPRTSGDEPRRREVVRLILTSPEYQLALKRKEPSP